MQPDIDGTLRLATVFYPFLSIRFHFQQQSHTDGATVWPVPGASNFVRSLQKSPNSYVILVSPQLQWFCSPDARAGGGNRVLNWGQSVRCTWLFEKQVSRVKKHPLHRSGCIDSDSFEIEIKME